MADSILKSIRRSLGPDEDYSHFDQEIIEHINSAFSDLNSLGVGPEEGFSITDDKATWDDYLVDDRKKMNNVITFVYLSVKLIFDPPTNAALLAALQAKYDKLEWKLSVTAEE